MLSFYRLVNFGDNKIIHISPSYAIARLFVYSNIISFPFTWVDYEPK
jgi:hypothetical protein